MDNPRILPKAVAQPAKSKNRRPPSTLLSFRLRLRAGALGAPGERECRRHSHENIRPIRHPRNPAADDPVAPDFHLHPLASPGDGIARTAYCQGGTLGHRLSHPPDPHPAVAWSHHPDGPSGGSADWPRSDVRRPRGDGAAGVRRQPLPAPPAGAPRRDRRGVGSSLGDAVGHSRRQSEFPADHLRPDPATARERRASAGLLHQLPEPGPVHTGRRAGGRVERRPGRRDQARRHGPVYGATGPVDHGPREADGGPVP